MTLDGRYTLGDVVYLKRTYRPPARARIVQGAERFRFATRYGVVLDAPEKQRVKWVPHRWLKPDGTPGRQFRIGDQAALEIWPYLGRTCVIVHKREIFGISLWTVHVDDRGPGSPFNIVVTESALTILTRHSL